MNHPPADHHRRYHTLHPDRRRHPIHRLHHHVNRIHHHVKKTIRHGALFLSVIIIILTLFILKLSPRWQDRAQTQNRLVCSPSGGMANKLNSNLLVVTNQKTTPVTIWVQENICSYQGAVPAEGYQCNNFLRRYNDTLNPGESKSYWLRIDPCQIGQLDINTVNPIDQGCFTPDGNHWDGGTAFAIKADPGSYPNCTNNPSPFPTAPLPPPSQTPTPTPTPTQTPTPSPTATPIPSITPTPTATPTPSPTPFLEAYVENPSGNLISKNICLGQWQTDSAGLYKEGNHTDCSSRSYYKAALYSTPGGYHGVFIDESDDIKTVYFNPEANSYITKDILSESGRYFGWPRWSSGGRTIVFVVFPTQTPTPTVNPNPTATPRPTSSLTINNPTPTDYNYHAYVNITVSPNVNYPTLKPSSITPTNKITPTAKPLSLPVSLKNYWPYVAAGVPIALFVIRLIL